MNSLINLHTIPQQHGHSINENERAVVQDNLPSQINPFQIYQVQHDVWVRDPSPIKATLKRKASDENLEIVSSKFEILDDRRTKYWVKDGNREGPAEQEFHNGDVLTFQYKNGKKDGLATLASADGTVLNFAFKDDVEEGPAIKKSLEDCMWFTFVKGQPNGNAHLRSIYGDSIRFTYKDGVREGYATHKYANKDLLRFIYKNDSQEGLGLHTSQDGTITFLSFKDGKLDNSSIIRSKQGDTWLRSNDKKLAVTEYRHESGRLEYMQDGRVLEGSIIKESKRSKTYEVAYKTGENEGLGIHKYANLDVTKFMYKDNKPEGLGIRTFSEGGFKVFLFEDGRQDGPAIIISTLGDMWITCSGKNRKNMAILDYRNGSGTLEFMRKGNKPEGPAIRRYSDGNILEFSHKDGKGENSGWFTFSNGSRHSVKIIDDHQKRTIRDELNGVITYVDGFRQTSLNADG